VSARTGSRVAWTSCAVAVALIASTVFMWSAGHESLRTLADNSYFESVLIVLTFSVVGALIVSRQPGQLVGWLFCASGLGTAIGSAFSAWSTYAIRTHPGLPGGNFAAWVQSMTFVPSLSAIIFLLLLFPDGRVPSPRWRWVARVALIGVALLELFFTLQPHSIDSAPGVHTHNPFGVEFLNVPLIVASAIGIILLLVALCASLAALVSRFRRSRGRERLQLKWITYAAAVLTAYAVAGNFLPGGLVLGIVNGVVVGPLLALAVGVSMLRHQLYGIDVVINRTLVYGSLTATLAAAYLGLVLLLQAALGPVTSGSSLAVAVSTLAVAALFRPARSRIQAVVDRRFYRHKYDAARTLEDFSARLREQVDLDSLGGELRAVVADTMQPSHVSLWLREAGR
jgi:MFS family permease